MNNNLKIVIVTLCVLISVSATAHGGRLDTIYTASGTFLYDSVAGILALDVKRSGFPCNGPEIGIEEFRVLSIAATTMTLESDGEEMIWTRAAGVIGDILGIWNYDDKAGSTYKLTLSPNGTFTLVGDVPCGGPPGAPISMITPYVNESDMVDIDPAYSETTNAPWPCCHSGLDPHPTGNLKPFRAVSSGVVEKVNLIQLMSTSNWQVEVEIKYNSTYSVYYAFEPMTRIRADGATQLENILVSKGQTVNQGMIIGKLYAAGEGAHVHFSLFKYDSNGGDPVTCPEPYFTPKARKSILRLIRVAWQGAKMCY